MARTLNSLAAAYTALGQYADAEPLFRRSLAISEKVQGPNDPLVATVLMNLAVVLRETNREAQAAELEKRAARIRAIAQ